MTKSTLNGSRLKALKVSGFRARIATKSGNTILRNRRRRGRWKLSISGNSPFKRKRGHRKQ